MTKSLPTSRASFNIFLNLLDSTMQSGIFSQCMKSAIASSWVAWMLVFVLYSDVHLNPVWVDIWKPLILAGYWDKIDFTTVAGWSSIADSVSSWALFSSDLLCFLREKFFIMIHTIIINLTFTWLHITTWATKMLLEFGPSSASDCPIVLWRSSRPTFVLVGISSEDWFFETYASVQ